MLQIEDTIISRDVLERKFKCDLKKCNGNCCYFGDSGAPLELKEADMLEEIYPVVKEYMREEGINCIEKTGTSKIDPDGDIVTPLIDGDKECAYTQYKDGLYLCAIEAAFLDGKIGFRKPISCHLFPVRIKEFRDFTAVNYEVWKICKPGREAGEREGVYVFEHLKEPLVRKFGSDWYDKLCIAGEEIKKGNI